MSDSSESGARGKIATVYAPANEHEHAKRMKALGIIPSISSLWMDGYQAVCDPLADEPRREVDGREQ